MGNSISIAETSDSPGIVLDREKNVFEISGRSMPENTWKFYAPVMEWLEEYVKSPNDETVFYFKLDYFNSSSAKKFIDIISLLERIEAGGKVVKVIWYHSNEDEIMKERGEEFRDMTEIPFEVTTY